MNLSKKTQLVITGLVFALTGLVLAAGIFKITADDYKDYPVDYTFLIIINTLFWFSAAFLLNKLIDSFVWAKIFKIPIGKSSFDWIKELISSLTYTVSAGIILSNAFWVELSSIWLLILLLVLLTQMALRPRFLSLFPKDAFARVKPFNVGDWIRIISRDGKVLLTGEVYNINRGSVFIKNEDNNLIFVSMEFLSGTLIENFRSSGEQSRFSVEFCIDHTVPVERVKRILLASLNQAAEAKGLSASFNPQVVINNVSEAGVVFQLSFWIKPWLEINPSEMKSSIISIVLRNLKQSGISPAFGKLDVFMGNYQKKQTDLSQLEDKKKLLKNVELLESLTDDEAGILAESIEKKLFKPGEVIIKEGESGDSMFILVEGLLNVYVKNDEGKDVYVGSLHAGDFFGEMSLLTGEPRSATVMATSESLAFELSKETISPVIHNRVHLAEEFGKIISERHSINIDKIQESQLKIKSKLELFVGKIKSFFNIK